MRYVTERGEVIEVRRKYRVRGESGLYHTFDVAYLKDGKLTKLVDFLPADSEDYTWLSLYGKMIDVKEMLKSLKGVEYLVVIPPEKREERHLEKLLGNLGIDYKIAIG